jgi:F-type H+-transporting ATPase subunit delta
MANVSVARRYARAILEIAAESNSIDVVLTSLESLSRLLDENAELRDLASNPAYTRAQRWSVMEGVLKALNVSDPTVHNLLRLLGDRNRVASIPDILRIYRDLADNREGRIRGTVTSARPLAVESVKGLEASLKRLTQRNVVLQTKVDPSLIAGVSAQVGSIVYDGSIRSQLQGLRETLKNR